MLKDSYILQAIQNIDLLIANAGSSATSFQYHNDENKLTKNWFNETNKDNLQGYLQHLINKLTEEDADYDNPLYINLLSSLKYFLNLKNNKVISTLVLDFKNLKAQRLVQERLDHQNDDNPFATIDIRLKIQYDPHTGTYTSPDDDKAHQHGSEATNIFFSTQFERFKAFISNLLAKIGIHVFEEARYQEHDYLTSDIYSYDTPIANPMKNKVQHYWVGHATNYIVYPNNGNPLHVLTDPLEGDLAPFIYPRMTAEGRLIDGEGDTRLPRVDVVVISHNHHDHVSEPTLKRLVKQQPKMIVPQGDFAFFDKLGFTDIVELEWWEQAKITGLDDNNLPNGTNLRITAVPARHWSGRGLHDAHRSAFNGYVFSSGNDDDIYFAGDTALMDDALTERMFEEFHITTSIQPGGPDENRSDMESTHQSSADGLEMHFKMLASHYKRMCLGREEPPTLKEFQENVQLIKTIYNHTATFKLGNLRLKDTNFSYQRMVAAFKENETWRKLHLKPHEMKSYNMIWQLTQQMVFADDQKLSELQIAKLILKSVVIPKIGQRQALAEASTMPKPFFAYRNLITNRRALIEYDEITKKNIHNPEVKDFEVSNLKKIIISLLSNYQDPWYSFLTRTLSSENMKDRYLNRIGGCSTLESLINVFNEIEEEMNVQKPNGHHAHEKLNPHGHMQSFIHYSKWLISFAKEQEENALGKVKEFFNGQQIRKIVDEEIHNSGWFFESVDRSAKQKAFRTLGDYFSQVPVHKYKTIFELWQKEQTEGEKNSELLSKRRSRQDKKDEHGKVEATHSTKILGEISSLMENSFFGDSPLKSKGKSRDIYLVKDDDNSDDSMKKII